MDRLTRKLRSTLGRSATGTIRRRIQNRVIWAVALSGIAAGLYGFGDNFTSRPQVTTLSGPNVRSLNAAASPGCNIKGNISITGERIYHVPGQTYYSATTINPRRGERWFCSEWEAWWAGWRKAKL